MAQLANDRRRITGPEESTPPICNDDDGTVCWRPGEPRQTRGPSDIRPIFLKAGLVNQANGSAYIETERAKIACAVYGPRQSKSASYNEIGKLNVEVKFAPFSCQTRRAPLRDAEDRPVSVLIHQALFSAVQLHLFPKSVIDVLVTVIECDGLDSCVSASTVACSTALADAGIEMNGLVVSCSAMSIGEEIWLDPNDEEANHADGTLTLAYMPALSRLTSVHQSGTMLASTSLRAMELCQDMCTSIHQVVAQALLSRSQTQHEPS